MKRQLFAFAAGLFSLFFLQDARKALAQQPQLSITQILNMPDTVYGFFPYDSITVTIQNLSGNTAYTDSIWILIKQDTTGVLTDTLIISPVVSIQPLGIQTFSTSGYYFTQPVFKAGGNTVVVWPVGKNAQTADSLQEFFTFITTSGIDVPSGGRQKDLLLVPNPSGSFIMLQGDNLPEQVRIFNLTGQSYDLPFTGNRINIEALKPGEYLMVLYYRNGKKITRKFSRW